MSSVPRIETADALPVTEVSYLDPGPLSPRGGHQTVWTGSKMIVWGGSPADSPPNLLDGAAFDPVTATWRGLSASPFIETQHTAAVWGAGEMLVVGREATVAYDPDADTWRTVGDGFDLADERRDVSWTGSVIAVWGPKGVATFDPNDGTWSHLGDPGFGGRTERDSALRMHGDDLIAVGLGSEVCDGLLVSMWSVSEWRPLPPADLSTDVYHGCSLANQSAVIDGHLVVWEDRDHPTLALDLETEEWREIATIPLSGMEGARGPVYIGNGILVPQWDGAAWLPSLDAEWVLLDLPGEGSDTDIVATGEELLMWGATCCYGAGQVPFTIEAWRLSFVGSDSALVPGEWVADDGVGYVWTVIAVDSGDVLNVRVGPWSDSAIVATLEPWSTGFIASLDTESSGVGQWRRVETPEGINGYVNARFVVAQLATTTDADLTPTADVAAGVVDWVLTGAGPSPDAWSRPSGLWVGGIGVYGDGHTGWEWQPFSTIDTRSEWQAIQTFDVPAFGDFACDEDLCEQSLIDYLDFDRITDAATLLIDDHDRFFTNGQLHWAPQLHWVVVAQPVTEAVDQASNPISAPDWKRIHFVFDWSSGEPKLALIQNWGWTP